MSQTLKDLKKKLLDERLKTLEVKINFLGLSQSQIDLELDEIKIIDQCKK